MQVAVNYAPSSNTPDPTASSAPGGSIRLYRGFGGKCVDANGLCLNDQRSGGSKVILYTCNGGANETWTHQPNGQFAPRLP